MTVTCTTAAGGLHFRSGERKGSDTFYQPGDMSGLEHLSVERRRTCTPRLSAGESLLFSKLGEEFAANRR